MDFTEEDKKIGKSQEDELGIYRMINGKKIYQIEEITQRSIDLNKAINRYRASGFSNPREYLNSKC